MSLLPTLNIHLIPPLIPPPQPHNPQFKIAQSFFLGRDRLQYPTNTLPGSDAHPARSIRWDGSQRPYLSVADRGSEAMAGQGQGRQGQRQ